MNVFCKDSTIKQDFFFNSVAKSYIKTKAHEKRFKALL